MRTFRAGLLLCLLPAVWAADVRLGIVGTDTSHAPEFTRMLNDSAAKDHVPGARVVAAFKGGSPDIPESWNRVDGYAKELHEKWNVEFVDHIGDLCSKVDGILIESVDGRAHLPEVKEAVKCGKPMFIDKPLASTLADAREIAKITADANVHWFSSSSLRYTDIQKLRVPDMTGAFVWGPGPLEEHHQLDLSWYAIHPVEMLYTLMGTGCERVTRMYTPDADVITGVWKDGRSGTVRAQRPYGAYGAVVFAKKNRVESMTDLKFSYAPLIQEIVEFMNTRKPPVPNAETLEIFSFLDAAQRSREAGGAPETLR
ncbi:MAG: Gfo/Idh/MocA family protein [Bryobacteraceae bacterium]